MAAGIPNFAFQRSPIEGGVDIYSKLMNDAIARRLTKAQAEEKEATNPYAAQLAQATARSKMAYSNLLAPQIMAKLITSDPAFAAMKPEDRSRLAESLPKMLFGMASGMGPEMGGEEGAPGMAPEQGGGVNPLSQGISNILNGATGSQPSASPMASPQAPQMPQQAPQQAPQSQSAPVSSENDDVAERAAKYKAKIAGKVEEAKEAGKEGTKIFNDAMTTAAATSDNSLELMNQLDRFHEVYKNSLLVGPVLGKAASLGPEASQLASISADMQTKMAAQLFGNKTSNFKEALAAKLKLNAEMPRNTEEKNYQAFKANANRLSKMGEFFNSAADMGIKDGNKIKQLWHDYNAAYPPYDYKRNKPIDDHQEVTEEDFKQFILNGGKKTQTAKPESKQESSPVSKQEARNDYDPNASDIENGLMTIIDSTGKKHKIYRDNLDEARKRDPGLKVAKEPYAGARI